MIWVHCYVLWDCVSSRFDSKRRRQDGVCSGNRFIWWRRSIEKSNFSTILHLDWIDTKWLKLAEELKRGPPSIFSQRMWVVSIGSWTPRCFLFTYYTEIAYVSENKKVACLKAWFHIDNLFGWTCPCPNTMWNMNQFQILSLIFNQ